LDDNQFEYDTNRPNIKAFISVGNKFIDAVWRSSIDIPLTETQGKIQIVIKETGGNEKKLGSLSMPVSGFVDIERNTTFSHWVTLFDYIEDDEYDGDLGFDDEERPRAYIRYSVTGDASKQQKTTFIKTTLTNEESKEVSRRTHTTSTKQSTITQIYSRPEAAEPQPERLVVAAQQVERIENVLAHDKTDPDRYSARTLESDLRADTRELVGELKDHQSDIFKEEDYRSKNLGHLEKLHKELTGEHIQDQITGFQIERKEKDIIVDYEVRKAAFNEHQQALKSRIGDVSLATTQTNTEFANLKGINTVSARDAAQLEDIRKGDLTKDAQDLRKENHNLRTETNNSNNTLSKENSGTNDFLKKHNSVVNAYNDTIDKFNKILHDVEVARYQANHEVNRVQGEIEDEEFNHVTLTKERDHTSHSVSTLSSSADRLKKQLTTLQTKYTQFIGSLEGIAKQQDQEAQELQDRLSSNGDSVQKLSSELKDKFKNIFEIHDEVDKENATNLNAKLRNLIDELVHHDSKRRASQENLDYAQTGWSLKLHLFIDEASRRSREAAREKRIHEMEKYINKIDHLTREIHALYTETERIEIRIFTDTHRGVIDEELRREIESVTLKTRWAQDERNHTFQELEKLLAILSESDIREFQESEINGLRSEIEEIRMILNAKNIEVHQLEIELTVCDKKIEELLNLLDLKNQEIDELMAILEQRNAHIKALKKQLGHKKYMPKGDDVDRMLADFLEMFGTQIPIVRLGNGFYLFGTKKIYAKIMNGKLVVRVGGGYMTIEEFVRTYEGPEMNKLIKYAEKYGVESIYDLDLEEVTGIYADDKGGQRSPGGRSPGGRSPGGKSPGGKSPSNKTWKKNVVPVSFNGSGRSPKTSTKKFG
jgi:chromosome segregation ATPase